MTENPPAFPMPGTEHSHPRSGMTLRDYFAAAALQGMANWWPVSAPDEGRERAMWHKATFAYEMADVMLAYRSKGSPT